MHSLTGLTSTVSIVMLVAAPCIVGKAATALASLDRRHGIRSIHRRQMGTEGCMPGSLIQAVWAPVQGMMRTSEPVPQGQGASGTCLWPPPPRRTHASVTRQLVRTVLGCTRTQWKGKVSELLLLLLLVLTRAPLVSFLFPFQNTTNRNKKRPHPVSLSTAIHQKRPRQSIVPVRLLFVFYFYSSQDTSRLERRP